MKLHTFKSFNIFLVTSSLIFEFRALFLSFDCSFLHGLEWCLLIYTRNTISIKTGKIKLYHTLWSLFHAFVLRVILNYNLLELFMREFSHSINGKSNCSLLRWLLLLLLFFSLRRWWWQWFIILFLLIDLLKLISLWSLSRLCRISIWIEIRVILILLVTWRVIVILCILLLIIILDVKFVEVNLLYLSFEIGKRIHFSQSNSIF
jgi:hypothetical protein